MKRSAPKVKLGPTTASASDESGSESDSDTCCRWIGRSVRSYRGDQYYAAFERHGEIFRVGDCVLVRVDDDDELWVASIESLWSDSYSHKWAETRWFYRPHQTRQGKRSRAPKKTPDGLTILYESDHVDENLVECFERKACVVSKGATLADVPAGIRPRDAFVCDTFYSPNTGRSRPCRAREPGMYSKRMPDCAAATRAVNAATARMRPAAGEERAGQESDLRCSPTPSTVVAQDNPFSRACALLQLSAVPSSLPCREAERSKVHDFLEGAITRGGLGCALYISGMPGTGKTATVHEVVRALQAKHARGELPAFQFVEINGMKLPHPYQAYTVLYEALTGRHAAHSRAAQMLERRFSTPSSRRAVCVVLVDELDYMVTRKQTVLYNLFDWPTRRHARLVVVGIANTMDLPERLLPRIHSRLGMGRLVFQPYTRVQIETIVKARLKGVDDVFKPEAVEMCARKVASISGDVRRALQICRRAAEICQRRTRAAVAATSTTSLTTEISKQCVSMEHINSAAKELCSSLHMKAIKNAPLCERLFLVAVYKATQGTGKEECHFEDVRRRFKQLCSGHTSTSRHTSAYSWAEVRTLCRNLGESRLLQLDQGDDELLPSIRLGVQPDDVKFALREDRGLAQLF